MATLKQRWRGKWARFRQRRWSVFALVLVMLGASVVVFAVAGAVAWHYRSSSGFWEWSGWLAVGAVGTIVLALGTLGLAISTALLAAQTRRDVEAQFQPVIVGAPRNEIEPQVTIDPTAEILDIRLHLLNAGRGVAMSTVAIIRADNTDAEIPSWGQATGVTIPAGAEHELQVTLPIFWAADNLKGAFAGFNVEVRYMDVARNPYGTFFVVAKTTAGLRFKVELFRPVKSLRGLD